MDFKYQETGVNQIEKRRNSSHYGKRIRAKSRNNKH
jgi:hypothetical protein